MQVFNKAQAMPKPSLLKMYIMFDLLHTSTSNKKFNNNGEGFDFETTKAKAKTIENGFLNLRHDPTINIGSILTSEFVEENGEGRIKGTGVLWKETLETFGIDVNDVKEGYYKVSMEVRYKDFFYYYGEELLDPIENYHLEEYVGSQYDGKFVGRVIKPYEFCGAALTPYPADKEAKIVKAIAEKYNKEGKEDMFKQFETEKEYNEFVQKIESAKAETVKEELKQDEDFVSEIRTGYVSIASVLEKFEDVELEGESLDDVVKAISEIKGNYETLDEEFKTFKKEVADNQLFAERKKSLAEVGVDITDEQKDEIIGMNETALKLMLETIKKSKAEIKDENNSGFNPNGGSGNNEVNVVNTFI